MTFKADWMTRLAAVICALLAPAVAAVAQSSGIEGKPLRVLILTGESDTAYHDWRQTVPFLERILAGSGRFDVRVIEELRGLTSETLSTYDAVVLSYNGPRWGKVPEAALEDFVRTGKGMVSLHGVTYGPLMGTIIGLDGKFTRATGKDAAWTTYGDMLGVSWDPDKIGHAVRHAFPVKIADRDHPITSGLSPEFVMNDELYHRMALHSGVHVLATAYDNPAMGGTGRDEPLAWTVSYGKGRTFHTPLGHDINAMYQPEFVTMFARAVEWAASGKVTLPAQVPLIPQPKDPVRVLVVTGGHPYPTSFYTVFEGSPDLVWSHATSQNAAFRPGMKNEWDVVVLYDMKDQLADEEKASLREFVEAGKGVVSLHHAVLDYTEWPWWYEEVIGGKYFEKPRDGHPASSYKEGIPIVGHPVKDQANHPIIRGLGHLATEDEGYKGMWHSPRITVLMETDSPLNDRPLVYLGPNPQFKAVYIQLGHGSFTHYHPGYRMLVRNAILWSAGRLK